MMVDSCTSFA